MTSTTNDIPKTMHAAQLVKYGPPNECFKYNEDVPVPQIKCQSQVVVRVKAAGVNPIDAKIASGNMKFVTFTMSLPAIIGADFSGIIVAKGSKVTDFEVGDEVFGTQSLPFKMDGTYAQYTLIDTSKASIAKKPKNLSFEQAATAGIAALTAYQGILKFGNITDANANQKRNILVIGASGGVGSFGIQIAKAVNSQNLVVGICSEKNVDYVKSLGADRVINYRDAKAYDEFVNENIPFDVIMDCVGGEDYYNTLDKLLKKDGVYSTAVGPLEHAGSKSIGISSIINIGLKVAYKKLFAAHKYLPITHLPHEDYRNKLAPYFQEGKMRGTIQDETNNVVPLKEIARAHDMQNSHRTVGKIVISID